MVVGVRLFSSCCGDDANSAPFYPKNSWKASFPQRQSCTFSHVSHFTPPSPPTLRENRVQSQVQSSNGRQLVSLGCCTRCAIERRYQGNHRCPHPQLDERRPLTVTILSHSTSWPVLKKVLRCHGTSCLLTVLEERPFAPHCLPLERLLTGRAYAVLGQASQGRMTSYAGSASGNVVRAHSMKLGTWLCARSLESQRQRPNSDRTCATGTDGNDQCNRCAFSWLLLLRQLR